MDEQSWLTSTDPGAMLSWLTGNYVGSVDSGEWRRRNVPPPSDRKLRLFAVACCRLCPDVRRDYADRYEAEGVPGLSDADWARAWCGNHIIGVPKAARAALLREIVGNPWRPLTPATMSTPDALRWYDWLTPAVRGIAGRAYDLRDWAALPILADALEDAGCDDEDVLDHLRDLVLCPGCSRGEDTEWYGGGGGWCAYCDRSGPDLHRIPAARLLPQHRHLHGPHIRGCWCVDLIIGKD